MPAPPINMGTKEKVIRMVEFFSFTMLRDYTQGLSTHFPYIPLCVSGGQLSLVAHSTCWGMRGDREHFPARLFGRKGKIITFALSFTDDL